MKYPAWMRDKLHALAIEADEMLGSCDASDILDTLEEARNAMTEGAEVIARLMVELEQAKRERDAAVRDMMHAASPEGSYCDICAENDKDPCRGRFVAYDCFRWRGVQEVAEDE